MTDQPTPPAEKPLATQARKPAAAKNALDSATAAATGAIDGVIDTAQAVARRTVDGIETNPLAVLAGGIAVGVLAGALLPRSERETEMLGPVGKRLTQGATAAARAARDAGTAELLANGISRDAARAQVTRLIDGVVIAVKTAGDAATKAAAPAPAKD